jgi:DNA polymerase III alpha subunit (gram-positive type)
VCPVKVFTKMASIKKSNKKRSMPIITAAMRKQPVAATNTNVVEQQFDEKYNPTEIIVVYDVETTGLLWAEHCKITDIAATIDPKIALR